MVHENWVSALGAGLLGARPLVARSRKNPRYGLPSEVEHLQFAFRRWGGPIGPWAEHFGKGRGQVYSLDGGPPLRSCNEVEVAKRLRTVRDHGFWFSGYNAPLVPEIWRPWVRTLASGAPVWLLDLNQMIRERIDSKRGGMPDVVAWDGAGEVESAIFVECKGPAEAFGEAQEDWVWAARLSGVKPSQVALSIRPF